MKELNLTIDYYEYDYTELKDYMLSLNGIKAISFVSNKLLEINILYDSSLITSSIIKYEIYAFMNILNTPVLYSFNKHGNNTNKYEIIRDSICCEYCYAGAIEELFDVDGIEEVISNFYYNSNKKEKYKIIVYYNPKKININKMKEIEKDIDILLLFPVSALANIVCNDGEISPTCTTCHKGCCSKHKGCSNSSSSSKKKSTSKKKTTTKKTTVKTVKGCTDKDAINYNSKANKNDGSCKYEVLGCTDSKAINYNKYATKNDNSCEYKKGCTNKDAINYDSSAVKDDGSCIYDVLGCTDSKAINYKKEATKDDNSCEYKKGCTNKDAINYDSDAIEDDGSCTYDVLGCTDKNAINYNENATKDDNSCEYKDNNDNIVDNSNIDGEVTDEIIDNINDNEVTDSGIDDNVIDDNIIDGNLNNDGITEYYIDTSEEAKEEKQEEKGKEKEKDKEESDSSNPIVPIAILGSGAGGYAFYSSIKGKKK